MNDNNNLSFQSNSQNNEALPWWLSWPAIVIIILLFWPVGVFLIWKRTTVDKKMAMNSGQTMFIIGWVLIVLGVSAFFGDSQNVFSLIILAGGGAALVWLGNKNKKEAAKFKKYIAIVINDQITSIDNIAANIPTDYETARIDLQKMINKKYLSGAYIDASQREIVLPALQEKALNNYQSANQEIRVITCKSCGANNRISSTNVGECEYCGSPISMY